MTIIKENFKTVETKYRPRLRYWWPGGYVAHDLEELDSEIKSIADAGFGGIEIADVYDAISEEDCQVLQPDQYGFTSENWKKSVRQALISAKKYGISVDLTVGPHWPASTNEATPNEVGTAKELVYGTYHFENQVPNGFSVIEACPPHYINSEALTDGSAIQNHLIAVYVAQHISHDEVVMPPAVPWEQPFTVMKDNIDFSSLVEVTDLFENGKSYDAINLSGKGILIAVYQRGTGQRVNMFSMGSPKRPDVMAPFAYVVDHFAPEGAALIRFFMGKSIID